MGFQYAATSVSKACRRMCGSVLLAARMTDRRVTGNGLGGPPMSVSLFMRLGPSCSHPSIPLAQPPLSRQEGDEQEEERPAVPDLDLRLAHIVGVLLAVERLQVFAQLLGSQEVAPGQLRDFTEQGMVGGGVLDLAVVLIDEEAGRVSAEVLPLWLPET